MSKWNYRIVQITDMDLSGVGYSYIIARVYYNDKGVPVAYTADVNAYGETLDELGKDWNAMADAFNSDTLTEEDFACPSQEEIDEYVGGQDGEA